MLEGRLPLFVIRHVGKNMVFEGFLVSCQLCVYSEESLLQQQLRGGGLPDWDFWE